MFEKCRNEQMPVIQVRGYTIDLFPILLVGIAVVIIVANNFIRPTILHSDGMVWHPFAQDFFGTVGENIGRHRPFFGFVAYLINIVVNDVLTTWIIFNYLVFCTIGVIAYRLALRVTNDKFQSFFFAIFPITSANIIAWLNHTLINVQGFALMYLVFLLLANYVQTPGDWKNKHRKLFWYSFIFGVLMLGKAQYNLAIGIVGYVILFELRQRWMETFLFIIYQFIPLVAWVIFLKVFLGANYAVYELKRHDYYIVEYWLRSWSSLEHFLSEKFFYTVINPLQLGCGALVATATIASIGYLAQSKWGRLGIIYLLGSCIFLVAVNFMMARHAGDLAIIGYVGLAVFLDWIRRNLEEWPKLFWIGYICILVSWSLYNLDDSLYRKIV